MKNVKRETRLFVAEIGHVPSKIFPLLCPTMEYEWLDGWECDLIYSSSGIAELDSVFKCRALNGKLDEIWVINSFLPNERVQFNIFMEGCILRWTITLFEQPDGTTISPWSMVITTFNDIGQQFLDDNSYESFIFKMKLFESMINHYLDTGEKMVVQ